MGFVPRDWTVMNKRREEREEERREEGEMEREREVGW